jgi:hypothetical protein
MEHTTSVGPEGPRPDDEQDGGPTIERVDAQSASELDLKHGRAGVEAKPFSPATEEEPKANSSLDPPRKGLHDEGLISDRRTPGRDDPVGNSKTDADGFEH